jgi:hypothetical protein
MRKWALAVVGAAFCSLSLVTVARGAADPLFVFTPFPPPPAASAVPPPSGGRLYAPCGLAVDSTGRFYVSDYYHHAVDLFKPEVNVTSPWGAYVAQLANEDPADGPCGLALDSSNRIFVDNYHRNVTAFAASPSFGSGMLFPLPAEDTEHHLPTGVAVDTSTNRVYVDHRTYVSVFNTAGSPIEEGGEPLEVGKSSLGDGYGVAVSQFPATQGNVYVPDAATNTVKVYDPSLSKTTPTAELKDPFGKPFVSLKDSAIAVDRVTGDVYFADDLQPQGAERPQASIYAYSAAGTYRGRLKYNVIDALPVGLAVDNSITPTQGRVYVTSGNTSPASIYAYAPGSATFATPLSPLGSGLLAPASGSGAALPAAQTSSSRQGPGSSTDGSSVFARAKPDPAASASTVIQTEGLRVSVQGKLSPKKLPRMGAAPISVAVGWDISTADGSPPPKLKTLAIEINRNGRFENEGLPTCPPAKIQPAATSRALSNCRSALVGRGSFEANIALKGQEGESYAAKGQLLLFNGEAMGKPVLYGQIYAAHPFATSFLIPFEVRTAKRGEYGTELRAKLPASLRSWGDLTGIQMTLHRNYRYKGKARSFVSAGCPTPKGFGLGSFKLARTSFAFEGGKQVASVVSGECRAG